MTRDEALSILRQALGQQEADPTFPLEKRETEEAIVVVSDLHAPFHDVGGLAKMIQQTRGFHRCVLVGDLDDGYEFSRFIKDTTVTFADSMAASSAILALLSEHYGRVDVVTGNHDSPRFEKVLRTQLGPEVIQAIKFLSKTGNLNYLEALTRQHTNVRVVAHQVEAQLGQMGVYWLYQLGDALFVHAERYSPQPGRATPAIADWLMKQQGVLKLKPWRVLFQGHTHQFSMIHYWDNKVLMETGCLCKPMAYMFNPRLAGAPQRQGYITFVQKGGVTDVNSIHFTVL